MSPGLPAIVIASAVLLAGCQATLNSSYLQLRDQAANPPASQYFLAATTETAAASPSEKSGTDADRFSEDVQKTLLDQKRRWEAALSAPSERVALADFKPGNYTEYKHLAEAADLDERLADGIELDLLEGLVHELNPGLKAAREDVKATIQQYSQAAYLDNILQQYTAFTKQLNTKIGHPRHKGMAAMSFPFPDTLALKGQVVNEEIEIARRKQEIVLRDLLTRMRDAYFNYLFVNEAIAINRENQKLLEQMIKVAQAKIRVDKAKYSAVIMAQVELSKLANAIITLEEQRETLIARINTLLNRPADAALGDPHPIADTDVALSLDELYPTALERHQELQQQRLRISKMETIVELATRMAVPDVSLGASYFEDRMRLSSGVDGPASFMTKRTLNNRQSPWFGQRDAYIREVEIKGGAMKEMLTAMEDQTRFRVKQEHFGLNTAKRSISLYRTTLLPQAGQALEAAGAAYRSGKTDFLTFLDTERTLLKFRLEEQRALRDFRVHLARLEQLVGHALPRKPLELQDVQTIMIKDKK